MIQVCLSGLIVCGFLSQKFSNGVNCCCYPSGKHCLESTSNDSVSLCFPEERVLCQTSLEVLIPGKKSNQEIRTAANKGGHKSVYVENMVSYVYSKARLDGVLGTWFKCAVSLPPGQVQLSLYYPLSAAPPGMQPVPSALPNSWGQWTGASSLTDTSRLTQGLQPPIPECFLAGYV